MTQDKDWIVDMEIPVTFEDGHTEQVTEITSADHSLTFAYAVDEETARLIAACPELLAALKSLSNKVSSDPDDYPDSQLHRMMQREVIRANLVIAKAEGKETK